MRRLKEDSCKVGTSGSSNKMGTAKSRNSHGTYITINTTCSYNNYRIRIFGLIVKSENQPTLNYRFTLVDVYGNRKIFAVKKESFIKLSSTMEFLFFLERSVLGLLMGRFPSHVGRIRKNIAIFLSSFLVLQIYSHLPQMTEALFFILAYFDDVCPKTIESLTYTGSRSKEFFIRYLELLEDSSAME
jgi:hypothetical protein